MWPFSSAPKPHTGRIVSTSEIVLALGNVVPMTFGKRWQPGATCTLFASRFVSLAGEKFFNAAFHEAVSNEIVALAVGEVWFHPDTAPIGSDHAIGCAYTDRSLIFIDPQEPNAFRPMSHNELSSIRNIRFL